MSRRRLLVITGPLLCLQILLGLLIFVARWPAWLPGGGHGSSPSITTDPVATSASPPPSQPTSTTSADPETEAINRQTRVLRDGEIAYRVPSQMRVNDEGKRVLADGNYAEWAWDVRPQKSGTRHLDLVVAVLLPPAP